MLNSIAARFQGLKQFAEGKLSCIVLLLSRLALANAFFIAGKSKLDYVLNDNIDTLYFLFEDYNVPFLPVKLAAWMGMLGELVLSVLIAVGFLARFAGLGLIVLAGVIYQVDANPVAPYWALLAAVIVSFGPGKIALDRLVFKN